MCLYADIYLFFRNKLCKLYRGEKEQFENVEHYSFGANSFWNITIIPISEYQNLYWYSISIKNILTTWSHMSIYFFKGLG